MFFLGQLLVSGVMVGAIYGLMALGIVLIYKSSGIFNIAVGEMTAFGCFVGWALLVQLGLPLWLMFAGLFPVALLLALGVERFFMRPLIGQPMLAAIMITIALMEILAGVITLLWPGATRVFPQILPSGVIKAGEIIVSFEGLSIFIICMLAFSIFVIFFQRTKLGLIMRASSEDQQLAQSQGVNVSRMVATAWFIAAITAFGGGVLLGTLHAVNQTGISALGLKAFPAVIVGGLESIPGAIVGGLLVGVFETLGAGYIDPHVAGGMAEVVPYLILLLVLIVKPFGLFGYRRIERV